LGSVAHLGQRLCEPVFFAWGTGNVRPYCERVFLVAAGFAVLDHFAMGIAPMTIQDARVTACFRLENTRDFCKKDAHL
jgi:hypothetical protein